ncbi:UNVERIFIED_CONTAM: hypothetical protein FKN15_063299 [Acipenser sinensis]
MGAVAGLEMETASFDSKAEKVTGNLKHLASQVTPGDITSVYGIRKVMGIAVPACLHACTPAGAEPGRPDCRGVCSTLQLGCEGQGTNTYESVIDF